MKRLFLIVLIAVTATLVTAEAPEFKYVPPEQVVYWTPPPEFGAVAQSWEPPPGFEKTAGPWAPPEGWGEPPKAWESAPEWR
ncbi:MAG: hypothetical protein MUC35_01955 [Candidatus Margulisbacteria bacterium]|jgi:hypothetical protein|nr:hypothetical protein [Candidatus Margulisiibacteriota bacterium]